MSNAEEPTATAQAILDATMAVIGEKGIKGATTRLIAEAAGVNEVTIFRNFGSKAKLINKALSSQFDKLDASALHYTGDLVDDLTSLVDVYQSLLAAFGPVARVLVTEVPVDPDLVPSRKLAGRLFSSVGALLENYRSDGRLCDDPLEFLIPALLGPIALPFLLNGLPVGSGQVTLVEPRAYVERFLNGRAGQA